MKTLFEYVMTPGRPAASRPASRTRAADAARSVRASPRAWRSTAASVTSRATPSRARLRARRREFSVGPVPPGRSVGPVPEVAEVVILRAYERCDQGSPAARRWATSHTRGVVLDIAGILVEHLQHLALP